MYKRILAVLLLAICVLTSHAQRSNARHYLYLKSKENLVCGLLAGLEGNQIFSIKNYQKYFIEKYLPYDSTADKQVKIKLWRYSYNLQMSIDHAKSESNKTLDEEKLILKKRLKDSVMIINLVFDYLPDGTNYYLEVPVFKPGKKINVRLQRAVIDQEKIRIVFPEEVYFLAVGTHAGGIFAVDISPVVFPENKAKTKFMKKFKRHINY